MPAGQPSTPFVAPSAPMTTPPVGPSPGVAGPTFPPPPNSGVETTTAFDPDQAELRWQDNRWQLVSGNIFLKDFGRYESEGREVLRVVRQLRLNTLTTVGAPRAIMEYWLANGVAPHGTVTGLRTLPLDASALTAEQVQGQWCIHDTNRILFNFGQQGDACRQALTDIQRYGFNQVGYVGQVAPVMLVFLANAAPAPVAVTPVSPPPAANPNRFPDMRFPHMFGKPAQPNTNGNDPAQPGAMPAVPAQSLNTPPGLPQQKPGGLTQTSLRIPGTEAADRIAIDPRQLQIRHEGNDWKVAMGNHIVANFGPNQADAQLAQAALRYYQCTEQVFIGNPRPMFSYFLSHGQAPHGVSYGMNAITFRPETLTVRDFHKSYVLYDGSQIVMSFGDRLNEAQQALQAIQQHKFDRLTIFGRGDQSMMLFASTN
jgi:hypothetical protein